MSLTSYRCSNPVHCCELSRCVDYIERRPKKKVRCRKNFSRNFRRSVVSSPVGRRSRSKVRKFFGKVGRAGLASISGFPRRSQAALRGSPLLVHTMGCPISVRVVPVSLDCFSTSLLSGRGFYYLMEPYPPLVQWETRKEPCGPNKGEQTRTTAGIPAIKRPGVQPLSSTLVVGWVHGNHQANGRGGN